MSSPSPLRSSPSKTNGAKLNRLLVDGGTATLQKLFKSYHPPATLQAALNSNYAMLQGLFKSRKINRQQWDLLFPPGVGVQPDSSKFDITLLSILFRNLCGLRPPGDPVWNNNPIPTDESHEADLVRIRLFRNELYGHVTTTEINDPSFVVLWEKTSEVLVRLGADKSDIDHLKHAPIDEDEYLDLLTEWRLEEESIKAQLQEIKSTLEQKQTSSKVVMNDIEFYNDEAHQIATGSKGTKVFEGRMLSTDTTVAVKVMFDGIFDVSEAKRLERLEHPNIIKCLGVEKKDQFIYVALELCKKTLSDCVKDNDFQKMGNGIERLRCIREITAAVMYLHQSNVCHRDIKPDNILLSNSDPLRFVLADFNIAKNANSTSSLTGNPAGSPGYIAPELYLPTDERISTKADVFALACVFFYVLTDRGHPFGSVKNLKKCQANIIKGQQPTVEEKAFREHAWIGQVIRCMLHRDPTQRPSAEEVLEFLEGTTDLVHQTAAPTLSLDESRRKASTIKQNQAKINTNVRSDQEKETQSTKSNNDDGIERLRTEDRKRKSRTKQTREHRG